jgi:hypothetical protein
MKLRALWRLAVVLLVASVGVGASCGPRGLSILPGIINDPGNRSLRKALLDYATSSICPKVERGSIGLRMRRDDPATGRFFPTSCHAESAPQGHVLLTVEGHGYAWTNITGRVGFQASASVRYDHDFRVADGRMYVYFRQVQTYQSRFEPTLVAGGGPLTSALIPGLGSGLGPAVSLAVQQLGGRILREEIARGFTVIREPNGAVQVSLGLLAAGEQPLVPFAYHGDGEALVFNDRSELHQGQRDYLGPITVEDSAQQIHMDARLEGASAIDVLLLPKRVAEVWLAAYQRHAQATPPPAAAAIDDVMPAASHLSVEASAQPTAQHPVLWQRAWDVPGGVYYIVLDHTLAAGRTSVAPGRLDDRAALVSYAIRVVDP